MTPHDWLNSENTVKRSKKPYAHFDLRTDMGVISVHMRSWFVALEFLHD